MAVSRGYHFYQNPGPTNIPDRVLRAMDRGAIDFTAAQFKAIAEECFAGLKRVFKTDQTILSYTASGHGAWEAALVNLFSPGDKVLVVESGYFSLNWGMRAEAFGLEVETLPNDWRSAVSAAKLESRLREDREHTLKAVLVVHNETSTGVLNDIAGLRRAITSLRAIIASPRRRGARCACGGRTTAPRSSRSTRGPNPTRSPPCSYPRVMTPTRSGSSASTSSTYRSAAGSTGSRATSSASAISAI